MGSTSRILSGLIRLISSLPQQYATAEVRRDQYYGDKATLNVWKTNVQQHNEFSLSQIWVMNQDYSDNVETIEAGWQIHPILYGDDKPRLFGYWTSDSYERNGCYNLQSSGFVQVFSGAVVMGSTLQLSVDGGSQYKMTLIIWKDPRSGNWWLRFENKNVGYWPSSMFDRLSKSATITQWGGDVLNRETNGRHTRTEIGSGYFPTAGFEKASYFKDVSIVNENNYLVSPNYISAFASKPWCYDIVFNGYSTYWSSNFYYGGPGRNSYCPI